MVSKTSPLPPSSWIRGVNIAGWLLAERMVTPYLFALNSCQLQGDWCFYPDQLGAPPTNSRHHKYCDLYSCQPHLIDVPMETDEVLDYPTDEKSLLGSFSNKAIAKEYMAFHWENFVTKDDVRFLAEVAGVEYVKVPIPHYAMNGILDEEPWVDGQWMYFVRFVGWARQHGIQVWIDMHTAFGTQNGFENSGESLPESPSCQHWINSPVNVERSIKAIKDMAHAVMDDNLRDVVTGFGILNEPFSNCPAAQIKKYSNDALKAVREIMGYDTAVYMSDSSNAATWNDGWWTDPSVHDHTYIDSHYYHVFSQRERALSPKQHIAYTCAKLAREIDSCCYEDHPKNTEVSSGVSRIVGEWSAGYDILPSEMTNKIMHAIHDPLLHKALLMDRKLSVERQEFLKNHVKAQMVSYESADTGASSGWFFWNLKMEGGAFAEWDFIRGIREGWIPKIPRKQTDSVSIFGSCDTIVAKTSDSMSIIHQFPDPKQIETSLGSAIDDDFVVSHGKTQRKSAINTRVERSSNNAQNDILENGKSKKSHWFHFFAFCFFGYGIWTVFLKNKFGFGHRRIEYNALHQTELSI